MSRFDRNRAPNLIPEPSMVLVPDVAPNPDGTVPGVNTPPSIVKNVYPLPIFGGPEPPDTGSHERMARYLYERQEPLVRESHSTVVWTPTGYTRPKIVRVPTGERLVRRIGIGEGWLIPPKAAAIATAAILGASVMAPAIGDLGDEVGRAVYELDQRLNPPQPRTEVVEETKQVPGPLVDISVAADARNAAGSMTVDADAVGQFTQQVADAVASGGSVVSVRALGRSSDEYPRGRDDTIGIPSPDVDISDERATEYAAAVTEAFGAASISAPFTTAEWTEYVLTPEQKQTVGNLARAEGFADITGAINAIERGAPASPELSQMVYDLFTSRRGVELSAQVQMPGQPETVTTYTEVEVPPVIPAPPEDPDRDYNPLFIPILPVLKLRWRDKLKKTFKWAVRARPIYTPKIVTEDNDHAWLRLRPEALREDGTLDQDAVLMTRKLGHLLREDRITNVLRADCKDADGQVGSVRILFVDHSPSPETVALFGELLQDTILMKGGRTPDQVRFISVFPSSSAGTEHGDPRKIALGIDRQSPEGVLGEFTPLLKYAELHMSDTMDVETLRAMFQDFYGPYWTIAHEVSGHAKDTTGEPLQLQPVRARGIANAHTVRGNPWSGRIGKWHALLRSVVPTSAEDTVMFDISYPVMDKEGRLTTITARVGGDDPRLAHAREANIVGRKNTEYAGASREEHFAEVAAGALTGIPVPFGQARTVVPPLTTDDGQPARFARGFYPDKRVLAMYNTSVGAIPGSFPARFRQEERDKILLSVTTAADDPLIRQHMIRERNSRVLPEEEMIAVLAGISHRRQKR